MKKRNQLRKFFIYVGIALLATAAGWFGGTTSLGTQMELRTYDYRFRLKGLFPSPTSAPITILAIDEESLERIPDPLMLWQVHFAAVLNQLRASGAQAIGLDVLFSSIDRFDPAGQKAMARALLGAANQDLPVPVILAYRVRENGAVDEPPFELRQAANSVSDSFGYANLTVDDDDFIRRQRLQEIGKDDRELHPGLALAVARAFSTRTGHPLKFEVGREAVLIDYLPRGTFPRESFSDALEAAGKGDVEFFKNRFAGRIVMIGRASGRGGDDLHSTPLYYSATDLQGPRIPGIDIQANTIAMLLDNRPIRELSAFQHLLIAGLISAALTFVWGYLPRFALASTLALVVGYPVFVLAMFLQGKWIWTVVPAASAGAALVLTLGANYVLEGKEKRRIRSLFKGYVSDAVIAHLLESQDGVVLSGERRRIAVLFADIKGFTSISETASPERVVQLLNEYFGVMVGIIQSHGGTVNSLMGDGIMAMFGAPVIDGDAALHAVIAGQEMMRALAGVNKSLQAKGYEPIGIGVGINSGETVIGNMGSVQKMEYTAIGDVVNTAARIEGQTRHFKDVDILITEDAYRWIDGRVPAEFIKEAELKGKGQKVRVYQVPWR